MSDEPYRTPADAPKPEWRELTSFVLEVNRIDKLAGVDLHQQLGGISFNAVHVGREDEKTHKLHVGQRVRVVLQILVALAMIGCSSSHTNDLFGEGTGGTDGQAPTGGSGGAAGAAGAGTGGVAGAGAAGAPQGGGGASVDAGGAAGAVATGGAAGTAATGGTGGVPPPTCACVEPAGNTCAATDFDPPTSSGLLCNYPGTTTSCCSCETGATPQGSCYEGVNHKTPTHTYWCCHT